MVKRAYLIVDESQDSNSILLSPFARKNLIQHGFIMGMKFAGMDKNKFDISNPKDMEKYEAMKKAIGDVFESHGLSREIEF